MKLITWVRIEFRPMLNSGGSPGVRQSRSQRKRSLGRSCHSISGVRLAPSLYIKTYRMNRNQMVRLIKRVSAVRRTNLKVGFLIASSNERLFIKKTNRGEDINGFFRSFFFFFFSLLLLFWGKLLMAFCFCFVELCE